MKEQHHSQKIKKQIKSWSIIIIIDYLLRNDYSFDDIIFTPNISNKHENKLVHDVIFDENKVYLFLNSHIFPFEIYQQILDDEFSTEYSLLESLLKIESIILKKKYQLLFIEVVGININTQTDELLARKGDFFPNSPISLSDRVTQVLRAYGYIYTSITTDLQLKENQKNILNSYTSQLGVIEIGLSKNERIKQICMDLFLREQLTELNFDDIRNAVLKDLEQIKDYFNEDISIIITIKRHPYVPFTLGFNTLSKNNIYSEKSIIKL